MQDTSLFEEKEAHKVLYQDPTKSSQPPSHIPTLSLT